MPTQHLISPVLPSTSTIIPTTTSSSSNFKQTSGEHGTIPGFLPSPMAMVAEQRFHVLAVDDSLPDRKLIEKLLKSSSYHVTTVDSGSKALEFLGIHDHDRSYPHDIEVNLIITDYCMPGMTGYDLLKKIKRTSSLRDIPVVMMSSENAPSRIHRCLEGGAEEFFLKPVQLSDMEKLRPHILRGRSRDYRLQQEHHSSPYPSAHDEEEEDGVLRCETVPGNVVSFVKRKALGDGFSPERTRTRYDTTADGLAAVVYFPATSE